MMVGAVWCLMDAGIMLCSRGQGPLQPAGTQRFFINADPNLQPVSTGCQFGRDHKDQGAGHDNLIAGQTLFALIGNNQEKTLLCSLNCHLKGNGVGTVR
jgi:hypothetical protein